jgi:hypothetical protein
MCGMAVVIAIHSNSLILCQALQAPKHTTAGCQQAHSCQPVTVQQERQHRCCSEMPHSCHSPHVGFQWNLTTASLPSCQCPALHCLPSLHVPLLLPPTQLP